MKDGERCASLNYEAEYRRAMQELEKAKAENGCLRGQLQEKEMQLAFCDGVKRTLEVICGRSFYNV